MDERVASFVGIVIAALVVLAVMNSHIFVEFIDDLRGVNRGSQHQQLVGGGGSFGGGPRSEGSSGGTSGSSRESSAAGGAITDDFGGVAIGGSSSHRPSAGRTSGPSGGGRVGEDDETTSNDAGAESMVDSDEGEGEEIPRISPSEATAMVFLHCEEQRARFWLVGVTPEAVAVEFDERFRERIGAMLEGLPNRPHRMTFTWHGCTQEQLEGVRERVSELCLNALVGVPIYDLATGRQLPGCGL